MTLHERLDAEMKQAMRARESLRLETIRGVRGAIRNREIEVGETLDNEGILRIIRTLVKQRVEAIDHYERGGRDDLVAVETAEKAILEAYLPAAPDAVAVEAAVRAVIAEVGANGPRDMGKVMKPVLERLGAGAEGKVVSQVVRQLLAED
jgi:uncharacterized protein YqeY